MKIEFKKNKELDLQKEWESYLNEELEVKIYKGKGSNRCSVFINASNTALRMGLAELFKALLSNKVLNVDSIAEVLALAAYDVEGGKHESK